MPLTPEQRSLRARIAANRRWSQEDPAPTMERARAGLRAKFLREVDPDGVLPDAERERRADARWRAHMQTLALRSSQARARRKAEHSTATGDDPEAA